MVLADRLKKTPQEIWSLPVTQVVSALHYFTFVSDYEDAAAKLNAPTQ